MAMRTRKQREQQEEIWMAQAELASAPAYPFYQRLNELLEVNQCDEFVEGRCRKFYAAKMGRRSLTPASTVARCWWDIREHRQRAGHP